MSGSPFSLQVRFTTVQGSATGRLHLRNIRHLADAHDLLTSIMGIAVHTFQRIIETYRSGEEIAFSKKYTEDWRDSFLSVKYVQYSG